MAISLADFKEYRLNQEALQIANCESSLIPDVVVQDDGGSPRLGMFQFKTATYEWMGEKFNLPHTDPQNYLEAREIYKAARRAGIAKNHWVNCFRKLKLI